MAVIMCFLCGCSEKRENRLEKIYALYDARVINNRPDPNKSFNAVIDNNVSYKSLWNPPVDIHYVAQYYLHDVWDGGVTMKMVSDEIGIDCLRSTETGSIYSVHRILQGGLLYIFYYGYDDEALEEYNVSGAYYATQKLSYKDFSHIKEGDTIEDIIKVDPTAVLYKNLYYSDLYSYNPVGICTYHYLEDGILHFAISTKDGEMGKIMDIYYSKDYIHEPFTATVQYRDQHILPKDRIE